MATAGDLRVAATRDAILDAALTVLERDGLRASRMEDIAVEAGVSRQSVYYHFRSREQVLAALIDRGLTDLAGVVRAGAASQPVEGVVLAVVAFLAEHQTVFRLLVTEAWGLAGDPSDPTRLADRVEAEIVAPVATRIAEGVRSGEIRCADPLLTARAVLGQIIGVTLGLIVRGERLDPDAVGPALLAHARAVLSAAEGDEP